MDLLGRIWSDQWRDALYVGKRWEEKGGNNAELCSRMERVDHLDLRDSVRGLIALRSSEQICCGGLLMIPR